eukprot:jgi/Phyca11/21908/fgenesh1_pg.PHYCAscaffold_211_\
MRLSQVLVIAVASFVFASDTVATSNQAKISKTVQSSQSQRLLRSNHYPVKEEEDESEDSVDFEERGFTTPDEEDLEERSPLSAAIVEKLDDIASRWGTSWAAVAMGQSSISEDKIKALLALRDAYLSGNKNAKAAAKLAILRANWTRSQQKCLCALLCGAQLAADRRSEDGHWNQTTAGVERSPSDARNMNERLQDDEILAKGRRTSKCKDDGGYGGCADEEDRVRRS